MKNYLLLLLMVAFGIQAQPLPSPSYNNTTTNTLKIKNNVSSVDFDTLLSQDPSTLFTKKRDLKPESTRLTQAISTIYGWGDSLTAGDGSTGSYLYWLNTNTGFAMVNKGVGGEVSTSIKNRMIAEPANYDKTVIIWAGRNNFMSPSTVKADIATMIAALTHTRYLVIGILNGDYTDEYKNTTKWTTINTLNADLKALYGKKFLDIRPYLVSLYNPSIPQDVTDHTNDVYPSSLRLDNIHPNPLGASKIADYINRYLGVLYEKEGYFQSKDFLYYYNLYDNNLHRSGNESFTGIKTTTNTTTPFSNGFTLNNSGGASSKVAEVNVSGVGKGLDINLTAVGFGIYGSNPGGGQMFRVDNSSNGSALQVLNTGAGGFGARLVNGSGVSGASQALRIDNFGGAVGIFGVNPSTGVFNNVTNQGTGVLNIFESSTASTGDLMRFTKNGTTRTKFDSDSNLFFSVAPQTNPATFDFLVRSSVAGASTLGRTETVPPNSVFQTITTGAGGSVTNDITTTQTVKAQNLSVDAGALRFPNNSVYGGSGEPYVLRTSDKIKIKSDNNANSFGIIHDTSLLTGNRNVVWGDASGTVAITLNGSATLNFPSTPGQTSSELTITVAGASEGDVVSLGISNSSAVMNGAYSVRISGPDTATVKFNNYGILAQDPPSGTFKVKVLK